MWILHTKRHDGNCNHYISSPQFHKKIPPEQHEKAAANKTCPESKLIRLENGNCPHLSGGGEWTYQRLLHYYATFSLYITTKSQYNICNSFIIDRRKSKIYATTMTTSSQPSPPVMLSQLTLARLIPTHELRHPPFPSLTERFLKDFLNVKSEVPNDIQAELR